MQQHLIPAPRNIIGSKIPHVHPTTIVVVTRADGRGLEDQELLRPGILCQVLDDVCFGAAGPGGQDGRGGVEVVRVEVVVGVCGMVSMCFHDGGRSWTYIRPCRQR